ncbi:MAG: RNA-binding protein [Flavobacteriales bacterium]|nr:RNA-binding protein [Flavobacteriales bacterium]|tara:strand:+ start:317 stop:598 length:282 start_codon:yes stop_codon:yes gene_type:complete
MNNNEIKNLLDIFLKKNNLEKGLLDLEVKRAWHELMENGVSNYTTDVSLKNKTLYIKLSSPALKEELSYGKEKLMKLINERFKKKIVQKIVLN